MRAAIIPADGSQPIRVEDIKPGVRELQSLVGGYFEVVPLPALGASMYVDEEGKLKRDARLKLNHRATALASDRIRAEDFIVGDVVLLGARDGLDNDTDLPESTVKLLAAMGG